MTGPALALIDRCRRLGIVLAVRGDRLCYRPVEAVDDDLRLMLAQHKTELLSALTLRADPSDALTGTDSHDAAKFVYLRNDDLDRRVIEAVERGETTVLRTADSTNDLTAPDGWTMGSWTRRLR